MKPVLLSICICLLSTFCYAQSPGNSNTQSSTNTPNGIDAKVYLQSKISEFDANASRSSRNGIKNTYKDLKVLLEEFLKDTQLQVKNAPADSKLNLQEKLKTQQGLYAGITSLSSDLLGNSDSIKNKLEQFLRSLY